MDNIGSTVGSLLATYGLKIVGAILILVIGWWLARVVKTLVGRALDRARVDKTLVTFGQNVAHIALLVFCVLAALRQVGVQTTSFIAVLGAAGLAVGLALQGSLSNFASGVLMILFRPFKVGHYIEGAGVAGIVEEVAVFSTRLRSIDNKTIIVPNAKLMADNITNYSAKDTRRIDLVVGIGYQDDIDRAKGIVADLLMQDERVLADPAPQIVVLELAESSVNLAVYPWVKAPDFWGVRCDTLEAIKKRFDAEGIHMPAPQREVHLYQHQV